MKITIESTDMVTVLWGTRCRIWRGVTEGGVACNLAIPLIRTLESRDLAEFEKELGSLPSPTVFVDIRKFW